MHRIRLCSYRGLGSLFGLFLLTAAAPALAADAPPATADVLGKLHESNQKEIAMGKMAQKNGKSKEVTSYGKMLVKDHSAADKKVLALAKQEKLELPTPAAAKEDLPMGAEFDAAFGKSMVEDHKKDIDEVTKARDATTDDKLKKLLGDMLPTLQKHEDTAQKIVDNTGKK